MVENLQWPRMTKMACSIRSIGMGEEVRRRAERGSGRASASGCCFFRLSVGER
jgi:hypothetical protein